jgi:hypothetical protein
MVYYDFNAQAAVEQTHQLIVGHAVMQEGNDKQRLKPMIKVIKSQSDQMPEKILADAGYCSEANLQYLESKVLDAYIATGRQKHEQLVESCK